MWPGELTEEADTALAAVRAALEALSLVGVVVFLAGMATNLHADHVLRQLRGPGETGYR